MLVCLKSRWSVTLIASLFLPALILSLTLRVVELLQGDRPLSLWLMSLTSDTLVVLGASVFCLGWLYALPRWPKAVVALSSALFLLMNLSEVISANFFLTTGSVLDFSVLVYGVEGVLSNWDVISSETPLWVRTLTGAVVLITLGAPWALSLLIRTPAWSSEDLPRFRFRWVPLGIVTVALGVAPAHLTSRMTFARSSPSHLLISAGQATIDALFRGVDTTQSYVPPTTVAFKGDSPPPNVVFILLESTRASATSLHGGPEGVTPVLEELSKRGIVMENAYAVVPHTSKALVATLCGFEPFLTMKIVEGERGVPGDCLPTLLNQVGYQSAFFQSATGSFEDRVSLVDVMGFQSFFPLQAFDKRGFDKVNYFGVEDHVMLKPSEAWIDKVPVDTPFFLTYLTVGPHHNYMAPEKRYGRKSYAEDPDFNRYLNAVHSADGFVGEVVKMLEERGVMKNTILVVLGDHGEAFAEHGRFQHDNVMYQEGVHVPMLIVDGRDPTPQKVAPLSSQLDLLPTVMDLTDITLEGGRYPGTSLLDLSEDRTLFTHCWYERNCLAAVTKDDKYIHYFDAQPDEVYDLTTDPLEKQNIIDELSSSDISRRLEHLLSWRRGVNHRYETYHTLKAELEDQTARTYENGMSVRSSRILATPTRSSTQIRVTVHVKVDAVPKPNTLLKVYALTDKDRIILVRAKEAPEWEEDTRVSQDFVLTLPKQDKSVALFVGIEERESSLAFEGDDSGEPGILWIGSWPAETGD